MSKKKIYYYGSDTKRGKDLAESLGVPYLLSSGSSVRNYKNLFSKIVPYSIIIFRDFGALLAYNPDCIIYEHGGVILQSFVAYIYCKVFRAKLIVDCHTGVYQQNQNTRKLILFFSKKAIEKADFFIAHNEETLKLKYLHKNMVVLESKVPAINQNTLISEPLNNKTNIAFITRFHSDEPIEEMIKATKMFNNGYHFYFTGNHEGKVESRVIRECENVTFTGFIPRDEYESLLNRCDVLVALTTRDYTLLYGGREAIAFRKPLVVSNNETCENYFIKGAVFVKNTSEDIKRGILRALDCKTCLSNEMAVLKVEKEGLWTKRLAVLKGKMGEVLAGI